MQDQALSVSAERPAAVGKAIGFLWASLAVALVHVIYYTYLTLNVFEALLALCRDILLVFLIWKIGRRREWARITLLVFFILRVAPYTYVGWHEIVRYRLSGQLSIAYFALQTAALFFLYTSPGKEWFQSPERYSDN
jgi:hypothetical protein